MEENVRLGQRILDFVQEHLYRLVCTLVGLTVGILFLTLGFWRTLLLVFCASVGWYLGGIRDYKAWMLKIMNKINERTASAGSGGYQTNDKIRSIKRNDADDRAAK